MPLPSAVDTTKPHTRIRVIQPCWISKIGHCPPGSYAWQGSAMQTLFSGPADLALLTKQIVQCEFIDPSEPELVALPAPAYIEPIDPSPLVLGKDTSLKADIVSAPTLSGLVKVSVLDDHEPIVILDDVVPTKLPAKVVTHEDTLSNSDVGAGSKPADQASKPR